MSKKKSHDETESEQTSELPYVEEERTEGMDVTPGVLVNGEFPTVAVSDEPVPVGGNQPGVPPPSVIGTSQDPLKEVQ